MQLSNAIKERKSVRKFSSRKPDWRDIIECVEFIRHAPMAGKHFTPRAIIVDNKEKISKIADACQEDFVSQAHYVVVIVSVPLRTVSSYGKRGEAYVKQQAGAAIQNFLLAVEDKKLATCWIGDFVEDQIKRELKIPATAVVEAVFPIGYEMGKSAVSRKIDLDNVLYFGTYGNKKMGGSRSMDV